MIEDANNGPVSHCPSERRGSRNVLRQVWQWFNLIRSPQMNSGISFGSVAYWLQFRNDLPTLDPDFRVVIGRLHSAHQ